MILKRFKVLFPLVLVIILTFAFSVSALAAPEDDEDPQSGTSMSNSEEEEEEEDESSSSSEGSISIATLSLSSLTTKSAYTGLKYTHNDMFEDTDLVYGIDVSSHQGTIDWDDVADDGIEYAIIRVGYRGYESGTLVADSYYKKNIEGALDAGLKVGVYIFTQAITKAEAVEEAEFVLDLINGYDIELPIAFDFEYASGNTGRLYEAGLSVSAATKICAAFADTCIDAGYNAMIYANPSLFSSALDSEALEEDYYIWLANYTTQTSYSGLYTFWQYSSSGSVDGIDGNVDCDFWYDDGNMNAEKVSSTKITLSATSKTIYTSNSFTLKATLSPSDTTDRVTYTSSKPWVAYVTSSGKVKGVSKGTTTITATTTSGLKKTCKVYVNENLSNYKILSISDKTYTGSAIKPSVTVQKKTKNVLKVTTTANLNIRENPGTTYDVVAVIPKGTTVSVYGSTTPYDTKWYAVKYTVSGTTYRGYVSSSYVTTKSGYRTLTKGTHYKVTYSNNKAIGKATVKVTGLGSGTASGTLTKTFKILPKKVSGLKKVTAAKTSVTIKWSKRSCTGYEIYRKKGSSGTYKKVKTITKNTTLKFKNTGLKRKTTYYYKVRAYKTVSGTKYYGAFSKSIKVTTK